MNALHDTSKNFIKAESSQRMKWALWHNVKTYCDENYQNRNKVFYKRRAVKGWKGPATVLGKEGNFILSQHGKAFYNEGFTTEVSKNSYVKSFSKENGCVPEKKENSKSDDTEDDCDKEENTENSEIKEDIYEKDNQNECDSSNEIWN